MKNSTVKEIRGQHGLECLSIQVSIMLKCLFYIFLDMKNFPIAYIYNTGYNNIYIYMYMWFKNINAYIYIYNM